MGSPRNGPYLCHIGQALSQILSKIVDLSQFTPPIHAVRNPFGVRGALQFNSERVSSCSGVPDAESMIGSL